MDYAKKFAQGLGYHEFLSQHGSDEHRRRWAQMYDQIGLNDAQFALLKGFKRQLNVICLAGAWCGDCVEQCPIFQHFQSAAPTLDVRYFDRDQHSDLQAEMSICGGARVPSVLFLSEDFQPVGRYGDRTLSKYRHMAAAQLGDSCPTGLAAPPTSLTEAVVQDWLDEFERIQLILRTSPRLRQKHHD